MKARRLPLGIMPDAAFPAGEGLTLEPGDLAIISRTVSWRQPRPTARPSANRGVLEVVREQPKPAG